MVKSETPFKRLFKGGQYEKKKRVLINASHTVCYTRPQKGVEYRPEKNPDMELTEGNLPLPKFLKSRKGSITVLDIEYLRDVVKCLEELGAKNVIIKSFDKNSFPMILMDDMCKHRFVIAPRIPDEYSDEYKAMNKFANMKK